MPIGNWNGEIIIIGVILHDSLELRLVGPDKSKQKHGQIGIAHGDIASGIRVDAPGYVGAVFHGNRPGDARDTGKRTIKGDGHRSSRICWKAGGKLIIHHSAAVKKTARA